MPSPLFLEKRLLCGNVDVDEVKGTHRSLLNSKSSDDPRTLIHHLPFRELVLVRVSFALFRFV
jgi:hypothetical protein